MNTVQICDAMRGSVVQITQSRNLTFSLLHLTFPLPKIVVEFRTCDGIGVSELGALGDRPVVLSGLASHHFVNRGDFERVTQFLQHTINSIYTRTVWSSLELS
jgi:hypothetical protein